MDTGSRTAEEQRLERERDFHDARFASAPRRADAFYVVNAACDAWYDERIAATRAGQPVLEYGCGVESAAFALARRDVPVTAIDLSSVAIQRARTEIDGDEITFAVMNAERLGFADRQFEVVCGCGILHHLDIESAVAEVSRVLTDDGFAIFSEPLGHNPLVNLYRRLTPGERSPDEHPLRVDDFEFFRREFADVDLRFFALASLLAIPLAKTRFAPPVVERLDRLDTWMLRRFAFLRRYAWTVVIELRRPRRA